MSRCVGSGVSNLSSSQNLTGINNNNNNCVLNGPPGVVNLMHVSGPGTTKAPP